MSPAGPQENGDGDAYERALAVKRAHTDELMRKANVVGVGLGLHERDGEQTGEVAIVVMLRQKVPLAQLAPQDVIPSEIDSVPVQMQVVGDIEAHT